MRAASRTLVAAALGLVPLGLLMWGGLSSTEKANGAEGFETYVACGLTRTAPPSHLCHLAEAEQPGAFFRSPTDVEYTVCIEFPTAQKLCAEEQHATAETLYVNSITSELPGLHRVTWSVEGRQVGSWEFRIPVDPPVFGKTATVVPVSGTVLVKGAGGGEFSRLTSAGSVRSGSVLDTSRGTVKLVAAKGSAAAGNAPTETGLFHGGVFRLTQKLAPSGLKGGRTVGFTVLHLVDSPGACKARASVARAARGKAGGGRLWGDAHGNFQTGGRYATVTVRGTEWLTEDTCTGTRVKVRRGVVSVRDTARHHTVTVHAPHSYLARPRAGG